MAHFPFLSVNRILMSFRVLMCLVLKDKILVKPIIELLLLLAKSLFLATFAWRGVAWGGRWPKSDQEDMGKFCLGLPRKNSFLELKTETQNCPCPFLLGLLVWGCDVWSCGSYLVSMELVQSPCDFWAKTVSVVKQKEEKEPGAVTTLFYHWTNSEITETIFLLN